MELVVQVMKNDSDVVETITIGFIIYIINFELEPEKQTNVK